MAVLIVVAGVTGIALIGGSDGPSTGPNGEKVFKAEIGEMYVKPSKISVKPGDHVLVEVTNKGEGDHDLKLAGTKGTEILAPGERATADFGVISAKTQAWCTVPEHKAAGMLMDVQVKS